MGLSTSRSAQLLLQGEAPTISPQADPAGEFITTVEDAEPEHAIAAESRTDYEYGI